MRTMENTIGTSKAAKLLGVSVKTLQRWEREKRLIPIARTATNRRLYTITQIRTFIDLKQSGRKEPSRIIAYCRVSSAAQKPAQPDKTAFILSPSVPSR